MTVSMRVMSAGSGYRYLLDSVAVGDGHRPALDYFTAAGTPPGRWLGAGLAQLGDAGVRPGTRVEEAHLARLFGEGRDPVSGTALGRAYPSYTQGSGRRAVAGYDLTFSAPKSVSVLWALSPPSVQRRIWEAHHRAIDDVLGLFEREVAATRMGATGPDGAVAQVDVHGVAAVAFDHWDSRTGDPQLHTHVVVSNKVRTVADGAWRSLDGRPVHAAMVALSEHYNGLLADRLARTLGVQWGLRARGADRNPALEISGVPQSLLDGFSSRTAAIEQAKDQLIADYVATHGRQPTAEVVIRLRQQATLATRPDKQVCSLQDLTTGWHDRAARMLDDDPAKWAAGLVQTPATPVLSSGDPDVEQIAATVLGSVGERRSTWHHWNLHAEASRRFAGHRFDSPRARETAVDQVVARAEAGSVPIEPPDLAPVPAALRRADGTSVFRPRHAARYTSTGLLASEDRLLRLSRDTTGPAAPDHVVATVVQLPDRDGRTPGSDQAEAVVSIARSGRRVDLLVGPAGTGKTTTLAALRRVWETSHGPDSVVGLAPSAAAARVLADELGIATENTAKWLHDHRSGRAALTPGQLVIIDEATLAGTHTLDALATHAATVEAKVLLVGDPAQLAAVQAGGAFSLLATDRPDHPTLTEVRRFTTPWEADASLQLRRGDRACLHTYAANGRVHDGPTETMVDTAYTAWHADTRDGRHSLLIAPTRQLVTDLNARARTDLIATGHVTPLREVPLRDGTRASTGDRIVTRRNDRRLRAGRRWIRNGDHWTVTATHADGSLTATAPGGGPQVTLPAGYVAEHVDLGYATTTHRAQGSTVDTAHTIVTDALTREQLYVAMSRGRHANSAHVCTDTPDAEPHTAHPRTATDVLAAVLARTGAEDSAHARIRRAQDRAGSIATLAAEYETIATAAQHHRWTQLLQTNLPDPLARRIIRSPAFGPLAAALRMADAHGRTPEQVLPDLLTRGGLSGARDPAAVLRHRVLSHLRSVGPTGTPKLVAGFLPEATGTMDPTMAAALETRRELILLRAKDLVRTAIADRQPWVVSLGPPPPDRDRRRAWTRALVTIAAYRDRHDIHVDTPLGNTRPSHPDHALAAAALHRARTLAQRPTTAGHRASRAPSRTHDVPGM